MPGGNWEEKPLPREVGELPQLCPEQADEAEQPLRAPCPRQHLPTALSSALFLWEGPEAVPARPGVQGMPALRHGHPLLPPAWDKTSPHLGSELSYRSSHLPPWQPLGRARRQRGHGEQSGFLTEGPQGVMRDRGRAALPAAPGPDV